VHNVLTEQFLVNTEVTSIDAALEFGVRVAEDDEASEFADAGRAVTEPSLDEALQM
jgi:hypothetical protein